MRLRCRWSGSPIPRARLGTSKREARELIDGGAREVARRAHLARQLGRGARAVVAREQLAVKRDLLVPAVGDRAAVGRVPASDGAGSRWRDAAAFERRRVHVEIDRARDEPETEELRAPRRLDRSAVRRGAGHRRERSSRVLSDFGTSRGRARSRTRSRWPRRFDAASDRGRRTSRAACRRRSAGCRRARTRSPARALGPARPARSRSSARRGRAGRGDSRRTRDRCTEPCRAARSRGVASLPRDAAAR